MKEYGGHLELTTGWARHVLKAIEWVKQKRTTGKEEPCAKYLEDQRFSFQHVIAKVVLKHDIQPDLVLNLDQTPLFYVSPDKYTFCLKGSTTVPIKGVNDKRQITATYTVATTGSFLSIQFIYHGKTERCIPKYNFP